LVAAAAWDELATQLDNVATSYGSTVSELTSSSWLGPSSELMASAIAPYVTWLHTTASRATQAATQAKAAVAAYETAHGSVVPPRVIAANRTQLATLMATNILGQNTPAIAATEAQYGQMWAQDVAAMYSYAGQSATATKLTPVDPPPQTAAAPVTGSAAVAAQLDGLIPQQLQNLATGLSSSKLTSDITLLNTWTGPLSNAAAFSRTWSSAGSFGTGVARPAEPVKTIPLNPAPPLTGSTVSVTRSVNSPGSVVSVALSRAVLVGSLSAPPQWFASTVNPTTTAELPVGGVNTAAVAEPNFGGIPVPGPTAGVGPMAGMLGRHGNGVLRAPLLTTYKAVPREPATG
jgi:PPE-repeat protein